MTNLSEQARESRDKILKAAEELFSNQGFDGVSVSKISEKAGCNKALIYYYFKSKHDILDCLFKMFMDDISQLVAHVIKEELNFVRQGQFADDSGFNNFIDFILKRRKILRVLVTESLKKGTNASLLFRFMESIDYNEIKNLIISTKEFDIEFDFNKNSMDVEAFFMGFIPVINFAIYYEDWITYTNTTEEEFKTNFINAMKNCRDMSKHNGIK